MYSRQPAVRSARGGRYRIPRSARCQWWGRRRQSGGDDDECVVRSDRDARWRDYACEREMGLQEMRCYWLSVMFWNMIAVLLILQW